MNWLADHGIPLAEAGQADVDTWLTGGPARYQARDFLRWTANAGHTRTLLVPTLGRTPGRTIGDDERWKWSPDCSTTTVSSSPTESPAPCCCSMVSPCPGSPR